MFLHNFPKVHAHLWIHAIFYVPISLLSGVSMQAWKKEKQGESWEWNKTVNNLLFCEASSHFPYFIVDYTVHARIHSGPQYQDDYHDANDAKKWERQGFVPIFPAFPVDLGGKNIKNWKKYIKAPEEKIRTSGINMHWWKKYAACACSIPSLNCSGFLFGKSLARQ